MSEILNALDKPETMAEVIGEKDTKKLVRELNSLKEQSLVGKKI
jgi:hypothetical protein